MISRTTDPRRRTAPPLASLVVALLVVGCARDPLGAAAPRAASAVAPEVESRARATLAALYPAEMIATHRALIGVRGRDVDLNGRLALGGDRGARLVAMIGSGQTAIDAIVRPDGSARVMRPPMGLRASWIEAETARDVACAFLSASQRGYSCALLEGDTPALVKAWPPDLELRHLFSPDGSAWIGCELAREGRRVWRATPTRSETFASLGRAIPASLLIESKSQTLRLTTLDAKPGPLNARLFEEEPTP